MRVALLTRRLALSCPRLRFPRSPRRGRPWPPRRASRLCPVWSPRASAKNGCVSYSSSPGSWTGVRHGTGTRCTSDAEAGDNGPEWSAEDMYDSISVCPGCHHKVALVPGHDLPIDLSVLPFRVHGMGATGVCGSFAGAAGLQRIGATPAKARYACWEAPRGAGARRTQVTWRTCPSLLLMTTRRVTAAAERQTRRRQPGWRRRGGFVGGLRSLR